jgi:hypothetical protein
MERRHDHGSHGPSITIQLDGDYNAGNIVLSQDKNGGTDITFNSSLLVTGTETTSDSYHSTTQFHGADEIRGSVAGDILFDDPNGGRVSATYQADGNDYKGAFHVETHNASDGTGSVDWTFDFSNVAVQPGKTLTQSYDVSLEQNGATTSQQVSVSIGGPGNDTFHFNPGVGADTIVNFNAQNDHIDLGNFANIQNYHELQEAITQDAHGDAVIGLGHGDSVTVAGLSENALKASLHSLVHLA